MVTKTITWFQVDLRKTFNISFAADIKTSVSEKKDVSKSNQNVPCEVIFKVKFPAINNSKNIYIIFGKTATFFFFS